MDLEKIKKLAEEKADSQERRGTSAWNGIYHGFIFGWQASELNTKALPLHGVINWVAFDFAKLDTRPPKYGKYLITRKDGKIHWETWNGNGWAYNHNEIRFWAEIKPPCL